MTGPALEHFPSLHQVRPAWLGLGLALPPRRWTLLPVLLGAGAALAHEVSELAPATLHRAWNTEASLWLLWLLPGLLVLRGIILMWANARPGAGMRRWQAVSFLAGWLLLGLAILSPLDALGEALFWAHMVQHEVVMLLAAPLLVLARPLPALVWGLPPAWRPGAALLARRLGLQAAMRWLTGPVAAWSAHAVVIWTWHAPVLFQAAVRQELVHDLQHTTFLVAALAFWWSLFQRGVQRAGQGLAVFSLFTTALHTAALGALLTFSGRSWYPVYAASAPVWGLDAVEDQQLAGLIMWVPGGLVYLVAALLLMHQWLDSPRRAPDGTGAPS